MLRRLARALGRQTTAPRQGRATNAAAPAVALEQLEQRQLMADSAVIAGTRIKGIDLSVNNIKTNQTLITIPFTGNIKLLDQTKIRLFGYALNPMSKNLAQIKTTIQVAKVEVLELDVNGDGTLDRSLLQITTNRLMRKGGTIIMYNGLLADDNNDVLVEQTRRTIKGQNKERFTLASRNFNPNDFSRYTNETFASSPNPAAKNVAPAEATVLTDLTGFLQKKVTAGLITQAKADAALARHNSAAAKGAIPDHNLRAALFSLTGTFAEGAIASWLDGANVTGKPYTIVTFQDPGDNTVEVARTNARPTDGRLRTIFRPELAGEPFQALSAWVAHEALHQDNDFKLQEESIAVTFGTLTYAQQALTDSAFMKQPSPLVNKENTKLLAFLNSGRTIFPYVGVLDGNTVNKTSGVLPGQKTSIDGGGVYASYNDYIRRLYIDRGAVSGNTAGNGLLNQYYQAITGKTPAANMQFSDAVINAIDEFQSPVYPRAAIILAQALRVTLS